MATPAAAPGGAVSAGENRRFKNQLKKADGSGARYALIFGAVELAQGMVTVKSLRDGAGALVQRPLADAAAWALTLKA